MRTIAIAILAVMLAGCGGTAGSEDHSEGEAPRKESPPVNVTPPPHQTPKPPTVEVGEKIKQYKPESAELVGIWQVHSAHIDQQRKIAEEYGGGVAEGPILVLDVSFKHLGKGYRFFGSERLRIYTDQTVYDPQMETGEFTDTYGFRNGEWYSFGDEIAPGATERGLVMVKLREGEEPRYVTIFSDSAAAASSSASAVPVSSFPVAKVDLSDVN